MPQQRERVRARISPLLHAIYAAIYATICVSACCPVCARSTGSEFVQDCAPYYIRVRILLHMLLYMCPHAVLYMPQHRKRAGRSPRILYLICVRILNPHTIPHMCPHTNVHTLMYMSLLHACPHTTAAATAASSRKTKPAPKKKTEQQLR